MTTPTTKEAMQAALKALEALTSAASPHDSNKGRSNEGRWVTINAPRSLVDAAAVALTLLRSALEEGGEPNWRPIETAPKDGLFLVYMPGERPSERIHVARWHPNVKIIGGLFAFDRKPATHWMPLSPEPGQAASPLAADTQDKRDAAKEEPRVQLGPEAFRFTSFQEWVNKAQGWFQARIPEPARSQHRYVAIDTTGRVCLIGADFMRARDEGTFPVAVYLIDAAKKDTP